VILRKISNRPEVHYPPLLEVYEIEDVTKYCEFHQGPGHDTKDCMQFKDELERLARQAGAVCLEDDGRQESPGC